MAKHFMLMGLFLLSLKGLAQLWVDVPIQGAVYQQDQSGQAYIDVLGSYPSIRWRTWQFSATLTKLDLDGNVQSAVPRINIPITPDGFAFFKGRVQAAKGWYLLTVQARGSSSRFISLSTAPPVDPGSIIGQTYTHTAKIGVGEVFIVTGQSNAQGLGPSDVTPLPVPAIDAVRVQPNVISQVDFLNPEQSVSFIGNRFPFVSPMRAVSDNASRIAPLGASLWCWAELGNQIARQYNVPVAIFNASWGGTTVTAWAQSLPPSKRPWGVPSSTSRYEQGAPYIFLSNTIKFYASLYGVRAILWHQGETDTHALNDNWPPGIGSVNNIPDTLDRKIGSSVDYKNKLLAVIDRSRLDLEGSSRTGPGVSWIVAKASLFTGAQSSVVRDGQGLVVDPGNKIYAGPNTDEAIPVADRLTPTIPRPQEPTHFNTQGLAKAATGWYTAVKAVLDQNPAPVTVESLGTQPQSLALTNNNTTVVAPPGSSYLWVNDQGGTYDPNLPVNQTQTIPTNTGGGMRRVFVRNAQGNFIMTQAVDSGVDFNDTTPPPPPPSQCRNANEFSGGNRTVDGDGKVGGFGNSTEFMEYTFTGQTAGNTTLTMRYASGDPQAGIVLVVNGTTVPMYRPATGSWTPNADATATVNLVSNTNIIRIQGSEQGNFTFNRICLGGGSPPPPGCDFNVAPDASNGSPGCNQPVTLLANCSGNDCGGASFSWSGNGQTYSGTSPAITTPGSTGNYAYNLTVSKAGCGNKTGSVNLNVNCGGFGISGVNLNCNTGVVTMSFNGANGNPVEYRAVGLQDWSTNQLVVPSWQRNNTTFTFWARQAGNSEISTQYTSACGSGRMATQVEAGADGLWVSPNPTSGKVVARFTMSSGERANLSVVNLSGQSLHTRAVVGTGNVQEETLDLSGQATGMYVVRLQTTGGVRTAKVMLQR